MRCLSTKLTCLKLEMNACCGQSLVEYLTFLFIFKKYVVYRSISIEKNYTVSKSYQHIRVSNVIETSYCELNIYCVNLAVSYIT